MTVLCWFLISMLQGCGTAPSEAPVPELPRASGSEARAEKASAPSARKKSGGKKSARASGGAARASGSARAAGGSARVRGAEAGTAPTPLGAMGDVMVTLDLATIETGTKASVKLTSSAGDQSVDIGAIPGTCKEAPNVAEGTAVAPLFTVTCTGATGGGDFTVAQLQDSLVVRKAKRSATGERGPFKLAKRARLVEGAKLVRKS